MKIILFISCLFISSVAVAGTIPVAYKKIGDEYNIPPVLLYSVALTESNLGKYGRPWPWTVNCDGRGRFFNTKLATYTFVTAKIAHGGNCDIGIMEINWHWHHRVFKSNLWNALDPYINIRGGARILSALYKKQGSFEHAVGAYHSSNKKLAGLYRERVRHHLKRVLDIKAF